MPLASLARFIWHPHAARGCLQDEERQRIVYMGWDRTAAYLGKKIKELGPFNGIMGFSQVSIGW